MRTHRNRGARRAAGAGALAAVVAAALAAGLTAPATAATAPATAATATATAPAAHTAAAPPTADRSRQRPAPALTHITLVTGDRVTVDAGGRPVGLTPAEGREGIPVSVRTDRGRTSVVPLDARGLIDAGRLDPRLFDLTELSRPEYRRARGDRLQLIVRYEGGSAPAARAALRSAGGLTVGRTYAFLGAEAVSASPAGATALWEALTDRAAGTARRATTPGIGSVWLDGVRTARLDKSTRQVGADKAWAAGYDGKGVKIAVLDTGIDATHPDLAGQVAAAQDFTGSGSTADRFGHGTHVASIAAGTGAKSGVHKGVAPGAGLLNAKVLDDNGSGDDSGILAGMEWAVGQGAHVLNLSLGGPDGPGTDPLEAAVDKLTADKGVLFAISAGNDGPGPGTLGSPGSAQAALTVGAVDDADALAGFSSTGPRTGDGAIKPDVTAPGVDTTAAAAPGSVIEREVGQKPPGYLTISGTSMAAPHAAGAAALLKQQHPGWTGADLKAVLTASAKAGAYSVFQQGGGRIAVDRAAGQSVVSEPVSLTFAGQPWPHHDDTPQTRRLTYRNLGATPVTLDLTTSVTGPDGKPAPQGFLTLGAPRLTVPAHGTASVDLTVDTRLGGAVDGTYSAYAVASGGGQTVRTPVAAEREVESYDLTVRHLGRDGRPTAHYDTTIIGTAGGGAGRRFSGHDADGTVTLRVPKGGYLLNSDVIADPEDLSKGFDWIARPVLDIGGDTTVTVDARTARPVRITVPSGTATMEFAIPAYQLTTGTGDTHGFGVWLQSYAPLRTAHLGPDAPAGTLLQQWDAHWLDGTHDEYHAVLGGPVTRLATGYTRSLTAADLATVLVDQGASAPGKEGGTTVIGQLPESAGGSALTTPRPAPSTVRLHLSARDRVTWYMSFAQIGGRDQDGWPIEEATYAFDRDRAYQAGKTYRERFNTGVHQPRVDAAEGLGVYREGDVLWGSLPLLADGAGHNGASFQATGRTTLYRDGVVLGSRDTAVRDGDPFTLPAGDAAYKLVTRTSQPAAVSRTSTKVTATWWFRSQKTAAVTQLPPSVVRFAPDVTPAGSSPAGRTVRVPVTVQGPAATAPAKSLTVEVSYDDGYTWRTVPVHGGKAMVKNPARGGHVSLRGTVADSAGNKSEITVVRAYLTH
ncbi:S8 family serine peptidase [Streptomyces sp. NPDC012888]|uniref:S8 family peptidase n=1 Tax=Streptomyces sp. NPDC012888 TaxID=3364855 RepID=UPI0036A1666F